MRLGLIARADSRGLGVQTKSFHDQMHPAKTLVVDCPSAQPLPLRMDWYPEATWVHGLPTGRDFRHWLQDVDVVYTAETGYSPSLWSEAARAGVKTVLHANYEFLDLRDDPTQWWAPSSWHFNDFPPGTVYMPVPITPTAVNVSAEARNFVHVVGRPAVHDRNGTLDLLQALQHVTAQIRVTIRCQHPGYVSDLISRHRIRTSDTMTLRVDSGDVPDSADLYTGQDILLMPRRFGGLCLPISEALGAGMPVIATDVSPQTEWLPEDWLVPSGWCVSFRAKQRLDVYSANHEALAAKIDQFATDSVFFKQAQTDALRLRDELSWQSLKPLYMKTFEEL